MFGINTQNTHAHIPPIGKSVGQPLSVKELNERRKKAHTQTNNNNNSTAAATTRKVNK